MKKPQAYPKYFVFPALILYVILFLAPSLLGIYYSFTNWNRYSDQVKFVGFENYRTIFAAGSTYLSYMKNTLKFTVISNVVKILPALFLAILLSGQLGGQNVHRAILFFPAVLPYVVIGPVFKSILHPQNGLLNSLFRILSLDSLAKQWLIDPRWVWPSVYAVDAWRGIGYVMTIFVAGLRSIPRRYYEAADIDGAGFFQKLVHITLPMLKPAITVNLIFGITYGLKAFDIIFVLTNGGPGRMTEVINTAVFKEFALGTYGVGAALSTLLFLLMAAVSVFLLRMMYLKEVEL